MSGYNFERPITTSYAARNEMWVVIAKLERIGRATKNELLKKELLRVGKMLDKIADKMVITGDPASFSKVTGVVDDGQMELPL
jgi:hypothetical protein